MQLKNGNVYYLKKEFYLEKNFLTFWYNTVKAKYLNILYQEL